MKALYCVLFFCLLSANAIAQKRFNVEKFGFSFEEPKDWFKKEGNFLENAKKYDWDDEQWDKIKNSNKGVLNVVAFHKYDANKYNGVIPTINLTISNKSTKSYEQFKQMIINGQAGFKTTLDNFKITEALKEITIDGRKALISGSNYTIKGPNGIIKLKVKMLYVPKGSSYYTINFIEEEGKEDNAEVFNELLKTIKLTDSTVNK